MPHVHPLACKYACKLGAPAFLDPAAQPESQKLTATSFRLVRPRDRAHVFPVQRRVVFNANPLRRSLRDCSRTEASTAWPPVHVRCTRFCAVSCSYENDHGGHGRIMLDRNLAAHCLGLAAPGAGTLTGGEFGQKAQVGVGTWSWPYVCRAELG